MTQDLIGALRPQARNAPESGIVAVMTYGRQQEGVTPLWAGEGDLPSPDFIRETAMDALQNGETFYTWQRGIPELRDALIRYHQRHFGKTFVRDNFLVTGSGMQSIQLALQATAGTGDEVIYLSPAWPNFAAAAGIAGATPVPVVLTFGEKGWSLDVARLEAAVTPRTKAIFINSPSNPTGWTADRDMLQAILAIAKKHDLWIIADEIYALFHFEGARAASFMDVMADDDKVIFVNSFSKNWAMTGWRVGWIKAHESLAPMFENLIQYSTSGVAQFMQKGAVAALDEGDAFIAMQVERAKKARDIFCSKLLATNRVKLVAPQGAFYLFFAVDGITDTMTAAFDIVDKAKVGLAPGTAFGPGSDGFFRICFNRNLDQVEDAADRMARWISNL